MTTSRHGNNLHPELPPCPKCGAWAWRTGDVRLGGFTQVDYTCTTPDCMMAASALFLALGFAAIFPRVPTSPGELSYTIDTEIVAWFNNALRTLRSGNMMDCVYSDVSPPESLRMSTPVPAVAAWFLVSNDEDSGWRLVLPGQTVDFATAFKARVSSLRLREVEAK